MSLIDKYLKHIEELMKNPEVSEFATEVYTKACLLKDGYITQEAFDDGVYLVVFNSDFDETKMAKTGINHIKQRIASDPQ